MPNLAKFIKSEIARISRREINKSQASIRKASSTHRHEIAALKRTVSQLQQQLRSLTLLQARASNATSSETTPARFRAASLVALRKRLDLSASDLASLIGVSGQSVYNWEAGKSKPSNEKLASLSKLRALGKREARARLVQRQPKRQRKTRK